MTLAADEDTLATLRRAPDERGWRGALFELGLRDQIRLWGLTIAAPRTLVPRSARRQLRLAKYENTETGVATHLLDPDLPLIELGAGIGVVSCFLNRQLSDPSQHIAVEASPAIFPVLCGNRERNGCGFEPVAAALSHPGFDPDDHVSWLPRLGREGARWSPADCAPAAGVATTSLAALLAGRSWSEVNLVADIEGAEIGLVDHELDVLREHVRTLVLEVHPHRLGVERSARIVRSLQAAGFSIAAIGGGSVFGFRRT